MDGPTVLDAPSEKWICAYVTPPIALAGAYP